MWKDPLNLWLPNKLLESASNPEWKYLPAVPSRPYAAYKMSAEHRGDMYHVRAAMFLVPLPLILHDCTLPDTTLAAFPTKDLENYLDRTTRGPASRDIVPVFRTCATFQDLLREETAKGAVAMVNGILLETDAEYSLVSVNSVSESGATRTIRDKFADATLIHHKMLAMRRDLSNAMIKVENQTRVEDQLLNSEAMKSFVQTSPGPRILILHRDTGAAPGGAHPELDSMGAIRQLIQAVIDLGVTPIISGNGESFDLGKKGRCETIGQYWTKLAEIGISAIEKRDVEALFLRLAYRQKKFKMVVGFRSGVLDLFTLLGIPTVSISQREYVGEERHSKLAIDGFQRLNIHYEQPRHPTTSRVISKYSGRNGDAKATILASPFWQYQAWIRKRGHWVPKIEAGATARAIPADPDEELAERRCGLTGDRLVDEQKDPKLGRFSEFDQKIVEAGIREAYYHFITNSELPNRGARGKPAVVIPDPPFKSITKRDFLRLPLQERGLPSSRCQVFDRFVARSVHPSNLLEKKDQANYLMELQAMESADSHGRGDIFLQMQEPELYAKYDLAEQIRAYMSLAQYLTV